MRRSTQVQVTPRPPSSSGPIGSRGTTRQKLHAPFFQADVVERRASLHTPINDSEINRKKKSSFLGDGEDGEDDDESELENNDVLHQHRNRSSISRSSGRSLLREVHHAVLGELLSRKELHQQQQQEQQAKQQATEEEEEEEEHKQENEAHGAAPKRNADAGGSGGAEDDDDDVDHPQTKLDIFIRLHDDNVRPTETTTLDRQQHGGVDDDEVAIETYESIVFPRDECHGKGTCSSEHQQGPNNNKSDNAKNSSVMTYGSSFTTCRKLVFGGQATKAKSPFQGRRGHPNLLTYRKRRSRLGTLTHSLSRITSRKLITRSDDDASLEANFVQTMNELLGRELGHIEQVFKENLANPMIHYGLLHPLSDVTLCRVEALPRALQQDWLQHGYYSR